MNPSPRDDLLASDRDWRARFRSRRRFRAHMGRKVPYPFHPRWLGRYDISRALRDTRTRRKHLCCHLDGAPVYYDEEMPE